MPLSFIFNKMIDLFLSKSLDFMCLGINNNIFYKTTKSAPTGALNYLRLRNLGHCRYFFSQARNFASCAFFRHYFASSFHNFAFCVACSCCSSSFVARCNCDQCFFSCCFYRAATCSVNCVFLGRNQNSFLR